MYYLAFSQKASDHHGCNAIRNDAGKVVEYTNASENPNWKDTYKWEDAVESAYDEPNPLATILDLFKGHLEGETIPAPETVPAPVDPKTTPLALGMYHVIEHWKVLGFTSQVDAVRVIAANFN